MDPREPSRVRRMPDDVVLFPERDDTWRILVWRLLANRVARWSSEADPLLEEGRILARQRQVSFCLVVDADSTCGELIDSHRPGPWRRQHGDHHWTASVFRIGTRFAAGATSPDGRMKTVNAFDSLLEAMQAADGAIPAHVCPGTCGLWQAEP